MSPVFCSHGHQNPDGANFCFTCGEPLQGRSSGTTGIPPALQPGTLLHDRYIVREELGQGGFGRTYLVEDTGRFYERLVLKEFAPSLQSTTAFQKAVELFQREAVTLYQLQHPQIPKFWEIFQAQSRLFLVQDFVEGQTYESLLNERIRRGEHFSEAEVLKLLQDLLPVLSYIHHQGVIHRDIAPDNIMLSSRSGLPVLIDMGAAKQAAINVTNVQVTTAPRATTIGKTGYAPDEQVRLGIVAPYSDLYALAVTAVVLMTGKQPQQLLDQYTMKWIWEKEQKVNPTFAQVLNRMLAPRPEERFQSADEVLQALAPILTNPSITSGYAAPSKAPSSAASSPNLFALNQSPANPIIMNNSGQGRIFDDSVPVPAEIQGWNWGAFLLGFLWSLGNRVWIGLLWAIPYVEFIRVILQGIKGNEWVWKIGFLLAILQGIKGNEWAWKSRSWANIEQFKANQREWTIVGLIFCGIAILFYLSVRIQVGY